MRYIVLIMVFMAGCSADTGVVKYFTSVPSSPYNASTVTSCRNAVLNVFRRGRIAGHIPGPPSIDYTTFAMYYE